MHDVGKPSTRRFVDGGTVTFHHHDVVGAKMTRKRMKALRFSNDEIDAVAQLVELHLRFHGYGSGEWTDSAVRRYVRDAGDQLERLHVLTRADCTTRNQRKADRLRRTYDDLEERIARLSRRRSWPPCGPTSTATRSWRSSASDPGREVGEAYRVPARAAAGPGPVSPEDAKAALVALGRVASLTAQVPPRRRGATPTIGAAGLGTSPARQAHRADRVRRCGPDRASALGAVVAHLRSRSRATSHGRGESGAQACRRRGRAGRRSRVPRGGAGSRRDLVHTAPRTHVEQRLGATTPRATST